jgi:hypothetical protein
LETGAKAAFRHDKAPRTVEISPGEMLPLG